MSENMGLIGRKLGMTQLFDDEGVVTAVTVIEAAPNTVLQVKTDDSADGYNAIQLGFDPKKPSRATQAEAGHVEKAGAAPVKAVREIRLSKEAVAAFSPGQQIGVTEVFSEGEYCDVTGTSKGSGFAGVVKRHNFSGVQTVSHGTHEFFRHGGSIGTRLTPGHVLKGKKMPGQMGNERVTVQNLQVVRTDSERGLVFVKGGVPGPTGGYVLVRKSVKRG